MEHDAAYCAARDAASSTNAFSSKDGEIKPPTSANHVGNRHEEAMDEEHPWQAHSPPLGKPTL